MTETPMSATDVARRAGIAPATLRRWVQAGIVPVGPGGTLSSGSVAHARVVARLRERGHSLEDIREATLSGRLATISIEGLLSIAPAAWSREDAARETGLEPSLITRIFQTLGLGADAADQLTEDDLQLLRHCADVLAAGLPLVAFLQLVRVYGHAMAQIADAEVRLFHLYVHEPLMRDGVPGWRVASEMEGIARQILPLASPIMEHAHNRFLQHAIEQDVIGHMEADLVDGLDGARLGRLRVAIAFADLTGYTRLTEELGDEAAVGAVERFVEQITTTLPDDARIIKTIGDEVMVVDADVAGLVDWAVAFQEGFADDPQAPRIGIHVGEALYRDGDFYGREVNQAARVAARADSGEVLVTGPVTEAAARPGLAFHPIGPIRLRGFHEPTELFVAEATDEPA